MNSSDKESNITYEFKNCLCNILGTVKLYYSYYPAIKSNLEVIISKIEELILMISSPFEDEKNKEQNCEIKLLELFYLFFTLNTNSTFYDLFLKCFQKFLKKFKIKNEKNKKYLEKYYKEFLFPIYNSLLNRKIENVGVASDYSATINLIKSLSMLIGIFYENINYCYEQIQPNALFEFFLITNYNLFNLSKGQNYNSEEFSKIINKTFKTIFSSKFQQNEQYEIIINILLNKILEISKIKDDLQNNIDDIEQSFHVDTLIICLKLLCKFFKVKKYDIHLTYQTKIELTKCAIELSFWDNPKIVNFTCKIFYILYDCATHIQNFYMKNELEIIFNFIFLRHYKEYFKLISSNIINSNQKNQNKNINSLNNNNSNNLNKSLDENSNNSLNNSMNNMNDELNNNQINIFLSDSEVKIKLSVIEIISKYINSLLLDFKYFLPIFYTSNDLIKIRFNIINELFNSIKPYFELKGPEFDYIKKTLLITYQLAFNNIKYCYNNDLNNECEYYDELSDFWQSIIKQINSGKFKNLYKFLSEKFNFSALKKNEKLDSLSEEDQLTHRKIAKSIALLIRYSNYVDIKVLFETMGENHPMSKLILEYYTETFNFYSLDIIKAYELYVSTFNLTGEQFHIYNFIVNFSHKYFMDNKELNKDKEFYFKSEEEVISFAYSTMILNTDLHNPNVTNHMSCDEFVKNNLDSKLFEDVPNEYIINIYNQILATPLKCASPRSCNYSKENELYLDLASKHNYIDNQNEFKNKNILDGLANNSVDLSTLPLLNLYENLYFDKSNEKINKLISQSNSYLYDDLFCIIMSLPQNFFELPDENVTKLLYTICDLSLLLNKKDLIDKIIITIHSIIKNSNSVIPYNLFFKISIKYTKDFHSYLEMYYQAILDVMMHKLQEEHNQLRIEYIKLIDEIIYKVYSVISNKRKKQNENVGIINYLFFSNNISNNSNELSFEDYKKLIYKKLDLEVSYKKNNGDEELIDINQILDILKSEEEEFIFFVTLAASKILDYQNKNEFYFSLIFLKEILKNITQKEFIKIWQNLFNIFKSKMEFKKECNLIYDNNTNAINDDSNLFDIIYTNSFLHQILLKYFSSIENEDYYQLLENYNDIEDVEILYIVLENNNNLIKYYIDGNNNKYINENIFEILISLIYKLLYKLSPSLKSISPNNTSPLVKYINSIEFLINLILSIKDIHSINNGALDYLYKIISVFNDLHIVNLLSINNFSYNQILIFINNLANKMAKSLSIINDEKWNLYMFLAQFTFKCCLVENEDVQNKFTKLLLFIFKTPKFPMVRYNQIILILTNWFNPFFNLKKKYIGFWEDVIQIFWLVLNNNEDIANNPKEIENLWSLFVKKYLISYVDTNKKTNNNNNQLLSNANEYIKNSYYFVRNIVNNNFTNGADSNKNDNNNNNIAWWNSTKNSIRLYFPDIVKDEK